MLIESLLVVYQKKSNKLMTKSNISFDDKKNNHCRHKKNNYHSSQIKKTL